jgi:hypothetical protein
MPLPWPTFFELVTLYFAVDDNSQNTARRHHHHHHHRHCHFLATEQRALIEGHREKGGQRWGSFDRTRGCVIFLLRSQLAAVRRHVSPRNQEDIDNGRTALPTP